MATVSAYRGLSNKQLAREIIRLYTRMNSPYVSQSAGTQSYQRNPEGDARMFSNAMIVWRSRGGKAMPETEDDVPGGSGSIQAQVGSTDFGDIRTS